MTSPAILGLLVVACAAPGPAPVDPIRSIAPGLYAIDFVGSSAKSTVVELSDAIAMIDVPIRDQGGDADALTDSIYAGEQLLQLVARRFPTKPLRYVVSSHWHPHSLSTFRPLLDHGVTIVTTRENFGRLVEMLPPAQRVMAARSVQIVDDRPFEIGDADHRLIARRVRRTDYPSMPTADYLFVELPRYDAVYVGCMLARWHGPLVRGRELVTRREEDVGRYLETLPAVHAVLGLQREADPRELVPVAALRSTASHGIRARELAAEYGDLTAAALRAGRTRLAADAVRDHVPAGIFNGVAYEHLEHGDLERAEEVAWLQLQVAPDDPNAWDTLGEITFREGEPALARIYAAHARRLDPTAGGGEAAWRANQQRAASVTPPPAGIKPGPERLPGGGDPAAARPR